MLHCLHRSLLLALFSGRALWWDLPCRIRRSRRPRCRRRRESDRCARDSLRGCSCRSSRASFGHYPPKGAIRIVRNWPVRLRFSRERRHSRLIYLIKLAGCSICIIKNIIQIISPLLGHHFHLRYAFLKKFTLCFTFGRSRFLCLDRFRSLRIISRRCCTLIKAGKHLPLGRACGYA